MDAIPKSIGLPCGFVLLAASFGVMATFLESDGMSIALFVAMLFVWALYGVAAAFSYKPKNIAYNVLDIVSKNFYGVLLTIYALTL